MALIGDGKRSTTKTRTAMVAPVCAWLIPLAAGCTTGDDPPTAQTGNSPTVGIPSHSDAGTSDAAAAADAAPPPRDASGADADDASSALLQALGALTANCHVASNGKYKTGPSNVPTVDICKLNGAYFWKAGMGIDCDGQSTSQCNASTAPGYSNQTSFTQSDNQPLVSSSLSYYVIPLPSSRFDYRAAGIKPGAVGIVMFGGSMRYGVFGDEGDAASIGSASYAMAQHLGINPDPRNGGVASGVTYIVFTGSSAVASPIESHNAANALGQSLTSQLLANN